MPEDWIVLSFSKFTVIATTPLTIKTAVNGVKVFSWRTSVWRSAPTQASIAGVGQQYSKLRANLVPVVVTAPMIAAMIPAVISTMIAAEGMSPSIAHFIPVKVSMIAMEVPAIPAARVIAAVSVMRIEAIVYMAVEIVGAAVPGAGSDEDAVVEPLRSVVAVRSATIRRVVVIPIGTSRFRSDVYPE